jgi:hypothetical protein
VLDRISQVTADMDEQAIWFPNLKFWSFWESNAWLFQHMPDDKCAFMVDV